MRFILVLFASLCFAVSASAATLLWDVQPTSGGALIVEKGASATGPFTTVATLPQGATQFVLTPGAWGYYRVKNTIGPSNVVQFSLDQFTGDVTVRLDKLEAADGATSLAMTGLQNTDTNITKSVIDLQSGLTALMGRVGVLETVPVVTSPPATVNISAKQIDANNIEVTGLNCTSLKTSGSGLRRNIQCVP